MKIIKLFIDPVSFDLVIGHASLWTVDGVWERDDHVELYVEDDKIDEVIDHINTLPDPLKGKVVVEELEAINWNAEWEANFNPVQVRDFCLIHAPFHTDLATCTYHIKLMPKMAFGTGHHETTYMMIDQMSHLDFNGKSILDFGCGTAVLAILAEKMGAKDILAIDHEEPAIDNSIENAALNHAEHITIVGGTLETVEHKAFDIILANINYNVLIKSAEQLKSYVHADSYLLLSGILLEKMDSIKEEYASKGWEIIKDMVKGEWTSMLFKLK